MEKTVKVTQTRRLLKIKRGLNQLIGLAGVRKGVIIVLYGINGIGKSTLAAALVRDLRLKGLRVATYKNPLYDLEPTGPLINGELRGEKGQTLAEYDFQALYAQNRRDFEEVLETLLAAGFVVIMEDYIGTSFAWGMAKGLSFAQVQELNADLLGEDLGILVDCPVPYAREKQHVHESNLTLMERCYQQHIALAKIFGWPVVNGTKSPEAVEQEAWQVVQTFLEERKFL